MLKNIIFTFIIITSLAFTTTNAQENTTKKATVLFVNTFDNYASFPVTCFNEVYKDSRGKLWIPACKMSGYYFSDVYSFDGYVFKKEVLPKNPKTSGKQFFSGFVDDKIYGYSETAFGYTLFYYDILKREFVTSPNPIKVEFKASGSQQNSEKFIMQNFLENEIHNYIINSDEAITYSKYNTSLKSIGSESINLKNLSFKLGCNLKIKDNYTYYKNWLVSIDSESNSFVFYDILSKKIIRKDVSNYIEGDKNLFSFDFQYGHIRLIKGDKSYLFKIVDNTQIDLQLIDSQFNIENKKISDALFVDSADNYITNYSQDNPKLFLKHNNQNYDISEIFDHINFNIDKISGSNFLEQFFITTRRNLYLVKVAIEDNVKKINTGKSARTIVEYDKNNLIFQSEAIPSIFNSKKINLKTLELQGDYNLCGFKGLGIIKSDKSIWGLIDGKLAKYNIKEDSCKEYDLEFEIIDFTIDNKENIIFVDKNYSFWKFNHINKTVEPLLDGSSIFFHESGFYTLFFDNNGILWILSKTGLFTYDFENKKLVNQKETIKGLDFNFTAISQIDDDRFLLGTFANGLIVLNTKDNSYQTITKDSGLPNNTIASITIDKKGYFWIGTYKGVAVLDQNLDHLTNLFEKDGLVHNECNRKSSKLLDDGRIVIGSLKGLSVISPDKIIKGLEDKKDYKIYFTEIDYYDSKHKNNSPLINYFEDEQSIRLGPSNTSLNLGFATSNFIYPLETTYSYKIKGIQNEWKDLGKIPKLALYSLPPGEYTIFVKAFDFNGNATQNIINLNVIVDNYFYTEVWFFILLFFIIMGITYSWINILNKKVRTATKKINQDKMLIELQSKKLEALDKAKSTFFTNITHEFRTPLTIINSVVELMKRKNNSSYRKELGEIEQNSNQLLDMVNQILALRKLESQKMSLNLIQSDIVPYIDYIIDSHQYFAHKKAIRFKTIYSDKSILMDFDVEKFKTILTNLLSNAIKYTPEGGKIDIEVTTDNFEGLIISIQDNGVGIPSEDMNGIFDYFHGNGNIYSSENSSGIGLNLTKNLVNFLKGDLKISSQINKGTLVLLKLPIQRQAKKESLNLTLPDLKESISDNDVIDDELETEHSTTILVVEDNDSLRHILYSQLKGYRVLLARNGKEGIEKTKANIPDIIISDVMMPHKNGYELCEEIKQNRTTSHIPVVLLTARADQESKIKGFKSKADAYIFKPYDLEELQLVVSNLLESRAKLQETYKNLNEDSTPTKQPKEDQFILELKALIEENIKDDEYGIKKICDALKISRMHLHNKLKALTGLSTSNFVNLVRLNKAKELLENTKLNISEISYNIGISNSNYFSKLFKKEFGVSPSAWRKRLYVNN